MPNAELKMRLLTQLCCGHTHLVISQSPGKAFLFLNNFFLKLLSPLMKLSWLPIFTVFPQNKCMPQRNEVCGIFFFVAQQLILGPGRLIFEVYRSRTMDVNTGTPGRASRNEWSARRIDRYLHKTANTRDEESDSNPWFQQSSSCLTPPATRIGSFWH